MEKKRKAQEGGTSTGKTADIRILPPANRCQNTAHEGALNKNNHKTQTHKLALKNIYRKPDTKCNYSGGALNDMHYYTALNAKVTKGRGLLNVKDRRPPMD